MSQTANYLDTQSIFNLIGQHADLTVIFHTVSEWLEARIPNSMVSIMLYSETEQTLNLISGTEHFSNRYKEAITDLKIGPNVGACGAAAFHRKLIICENLAIDKNWEFLKNLIQEENLNACWSTPIINVQGKLYGTFGTYYRSPKCPNDTHIKLIRHAASLVALSMDLHAERQQRLALNDKYRSFFTYHPDAIFEHNLEGIIIDVNLASKDLSKFSLEQTLGLHFSKFICAESQSIAQTAFEKAVKGNGQHLEIQALNALGECHWLDVTYLPIKQAEQVVGVFGIARDITDRRETEEMLRLLKRSVDANPHGIVLANATQNQAIEYVNPAFESLTGYTKEEVIGQNCRFLQGPDTEPETVNKIQNAIKEQQEIQVVLKNYRKDGSWFWNQLILGPVFDDKNFCTHFIGIQQDITQQRANSEYIERQQTHDNLTGLINHHTFEETLDVAFCIQHESHQSLIVMYIDLDDFQPLNQSLGHLIGDQLLSAVANRLRQVIQEEDVVSHFSGDEFAILLNKCHDLKEVAVIAERILKSLSVPFDIDNHKIHISASIGIADNDPQIEKSKQLLHHAIHAMSEAKKEGGNTWHWYAFNATRTPKIDYVHMRHELMLALEEKQFKLVYQPVIDADSGQLKSVEALIRWQHPQRGLISPADFIPFAERTGQIVVIGQWVLQQACQDIVEWNKKHAATLSVAVNLSPLQFRRTGFLHDLQKTLADTQLPPELLKIEVTETMLIAGADRSSEILNAVRDLGVKVSVDDFGTGYSSLSYLRTLPIDEIKLDRGFIEHLPENEKDGAIVAAIIVMAHKLGLQVVAEGIETQAQAQFLRKYQCDYFQGYYFARPASLAELKLSYEQVELL
ncbi:bifunctional diguanylate cyclase/phosphodiesterase [Acinetobacter terrestris]|uniref:bifunctional diguanylate cyclase/phosphodiesterase n=1 Tax=Acinetobacter terrestris TaxID=2529843 RepID=UPI001038F3F8|nr:EAL domain-containing protein [Acinetobacter terrestris]TCB64190.1 GGDEF domain-containing protein [Acinetobacter terrestris]